MKKIVASTFVLMSIVFIFFFALMSFTGCKQTTPKELDIYIWEGYLTEEAASLFESETGIKLNISYATDTPMMLTLLQGGGKADIIMPTHSYTNRFYEADVVQPIDLEQIPNYKNVFEYLKDMNWAKWDGSRMGSGEIYAIPYVFGTNGLIINTSKYTGNLKNIGWEVLFNIDLKGRVSARNAVDSLFLILDMKGIARENLITDTQGTMEQTRDKAIELKNNVLKFYGTGSEIIDIMKNEEVWVSYIQDGNARKLEQFDNKFKYVLPGTGAPAWADTFMIPKSASNLKGANLFIDFMLRPEIAAELTEQSGYTTTVEGALDIAQGVDKNLYIFSDEEMANLIWYPNLNEEAREISVAFWEELSTME